MHILYRHEVIDCVGYLKDAVNDKNCLVYAQLAQLSLQKYRIHRKLSDLINTAPPKSRLSERMKDIPNLTLFTYYLLLAKPQPDKIIFLYVTPEDDTSLLEELKHDLQLVQRYADVNQLKVGLYAGMIGRQSAFFSEMTRFQKKAFV